MANLKTANKGQAHSFEHKSKNDKKGIFERSLIWIKSKKISKKRIRIVVIATQGYQVGLKITFAEHFKARIGPRK